MTHTDFGLTRRHIEILQAVADGMQMQEIADRLGIQPESVSRAIGRASLLLGTRSRSHTVAELVRKGLIE